MYENGRIFKLIDANTDEVLMIGSTTINLRQKLSEFKYNYGKKKSIQRYSLFYDRLGSDNIAIELIQRFPCSSKEELEAKENEIRRLYKAGKTVPIIPIVLQ